MSKSGIYNCATVNYSPETMKTLKVLMEEARLSLSMRHKFEKYIRGGEPLPQPKPRAYSAPPRQSNDLFGMKKNLHFTRRSRQQIEESGFYELEEFRPRPSVDREKEKEKFQNIMEFGNKEGARNKRPQRKSSVLIKQTVIPFTREHRMEELSREIEDRIQFLEDMKDLGQKKKYEQSMKQEIGEKLREMVKLQKITDEDFELLYPSKKT